METMSCASGSVCLASSERKSGRVSWAKERPSTAISARCRAILSAEGESA